MRFPTQRLTITTAEYLLLKPGLDVLANGLASAKLGFFPRRHPYHRVDFVTSDIHRDQAYDSEMASRIINVRGKLWELSQSRKVRLDAFELAAVALALRLWKDHKSTCALQTAYPEIKCLGGKVEAYRKRAKRAAVARFGTTLYQEAANRWQKLAAWARYNLLQFKLPKHGKPMRANRWREERQQLTQAISSSLADKFYEALNERQMERIVTLATTSLRRCRHPMGLRELLRAPQDHADFLVEFVVKRLNLKRLPGAPVPHWQQITDRADKFRAFKELRKVPVIQLTTEPEVTRTSLTQKPLPKIPDTLQVKTASKGGIAVTDDTLINAMAQIVSQISEIGLSEQVVEQAKFQITCRLDQYKRATFARRFNQLVEELSPSAHSTDAYELINQYVDWLLGLTLALGREPPFIYRALGAALYRAKQLEVVG